MKTLAAICASNLLLVAPAIADMEEIGPGQELAKLVFGSIEARPNGLADMGEFTAFGNDIFVSMDADGSNTITFDEFTDWDFGFTFIAEDETQQRAYETAQMILFAFWDRDGDGDIDSSEYHKSMIADFRSADINGDAFLSEEEFLTGYIVNRAYRAALAGK
ncbi:signal transduction protein [Dinoroseobacter sp. S124A]|uniref:signal transduction protein n=1 Tax=Dinoroseobacter sp. S124A TaxID=3415128 RepID=UPI003C7E9AD0